MRMIIVAALALLMLPAGVVADQPVVALSGERGSAFEAPAPWSQQDPADSLYRAAREAMNRGEYERAASLFHQVWDRYPRSTYAPDAPYWEAFNRYRAGETGDLERALQLLDLQAERYGKARTRANGDAEALRTRIRGMLARRGDADAAEAIVASANEVAGMGARIGVEVGARMAAVAEELAVRGEVLGERLARIAEEGAAIGMVAGPSRQEIPPQCRDQVESQLAALNALITMSADRAMPVLKRVMERRDECAAPLRRHAVFMIADKGSPDAIDVLLDAAQNDPDLEVRRQAVFWLSEVDDPRAVSALESFLATSQDDRIRERAVFALSQHDSPEARRILRRVAEDESASVQLRSKAIFWLGNEGTAEDIEYLKGRFGKLPDRSLNERILFTVGQAEREEDARWLLSIAASDDVDADLRRTAIFWAAEAGAPASALGDLYRRVQDRTLRERILFGLSESDDPAAIDKLIEIVRTETDPGLRKKAIFWVGNSDDERAADVLMEILMGGDEGGR
ncbi:MAG: HEAT repeat domain-containing protein [Gemmatimonadota bacterium]